MAEEHDAAPPTNAAAAAASSRIAVVIPNWNSLDYLRDCLASLSDGQPAHELLVVDNGSQDGSLEWLEREGIPHIALEHNIGFAAAVNLAAAHTQAPFLMVLNADATLEPGCLERLAGALEGAASLAGVQPRILQIPVAAASTQTGAAPSPAEREPGTARIYSAGQALTRDGRGVELDAGAPQRPEHRTRREVFGVCGAACLLRRDLFSELGGYDERYFSFCEDVDLNVRARVAGWSFATIGDAIAWHHGNATWQVGFSSPAAENARLVARNRLATQIKFMPATALPRIAAIEAGALLLALRQRRLIATLSGKLAALRWLPSLLEDRRGLHRTGDLRSARAWLGRPAEMIPSGRAL